MASAAPPALEMQEEPAPSGAAAEAILAREAEDGTAPPPEDAEACEPAYSNASRAALVLTAIGIVYGDIGTSPLYVLRACLTAAGGGAVASAADVLGVLSLITWAIVLVVCVKYALFVMRADYRGEGGIIAMIQLLRAQLGPARAGALGAWTIIGLVGAALLYGDGMVTPAISILSAVEGLEVIAPTFSRAVLPVSLVLIAALFAVQRRGTQRVGRVFGPVMLVWFVVIAALGAREVAAHPAVLRALSPAYAVQFFGAHGVAGFLVLGAVVLAVTGAEALYADMGHCGVPAIRGAWFGIAFPALLLSYFGQGSLVLRAPAALANPFFQLAPRWALVPLVLLATAATCIASQALISGAFSLTRQLMHLGYSPLVTVTHTSAEHEGQVYVPQVNALLFVGCVLLVLGFGSSERLAAAYGLAVSGTMAATTLLFYRVTRGCWKWSAGLAGALAAGFLVIDLSFVGANLAKIPHGGWVPLVVAGLLVVLSTTWRRGRQTLLARRDRASMPLEELFGHLDRARPCRVPGTAVFLTLSDDDDAPTVLMHHLAHIPALHERVVLLGVSAVAAARVPAARRVTVERMEHGFVRVTARYGYAQRVSVLEALAECTRLGLAVDPARATFYVGRERVLAAGAANGGRSLPRWRARLFALLHRNALSAQDFMGLPADRVVELGRRVAM